MLKLVEGPDLSKKLDNSENTSFKNNIINETLACQNIERVSTGDIRFWGVPPETNMALEELFNFALAQYESVTGKAPENATIMVNYINSEHCPMGSGNGWHRDSWKDQYKAFMYLSDVESVDQGAFAYVDKTNLFLIKLISLFNRVIFGGNRYSNNYIKVLNAFGFKSIPILKKAFRPFFLNTSLIHRGLEIKSGFRMMATVYLFENISSKIGNHINK
jgi:hypothetical protein